MRIPMHEHDVLIVFNRILINNFSREKDLAKLSWERCLLYDNSAIAG